MSLDIVDSPQYFGRMYAKLFSSLLSSSVWSEDSDTCKVWITLIALADREGFVFGSVAGIARICALPIPVVDAAIEKFMAPDPHSTDKTRHPDRAGRRIEAVDGGWHLLNYGYYRDLADADVRRAQYRTSKRRIRGQSKNVNNSQQPSTSVHPSESESDTESSSEEERDIDHFEESFWAVYPRKVGKQQALKAWLRLSPEERLVADEGVRKLAIEWKDRPPEERHFCPHAATWINGKRWQDEPEPKPVPQPEDPKVARRKAEEDWKLRQQEQVARELAAEKAAYEAHHKK